MNDMFLWYSVNPNIWRKVYRIHKRRIRDTSGILWCNQKKYYFNIGVGIFRRHRPIEKCTPHFFGTDSPGETHCFDCCLISDVFWWIHDLDQHHWIMYVRPAANEHSLYTNNISWTFFILSGIGISRKFNKQIFYPWNFWCRLHSVY